MTDYQIAAYDHNGIESISHRIVLSFDEKFTQSNVIARLRRSLATLLDQSMEQAQIRDANGQPLTPVMSLERNAA